MDISQIGNIVGSVGNAMAGAGGGRPLYNPPPASGGAAEQSPIAMLIHTLRNRGGAQAGGPPAPFAQPAGLNGVGAPGPIGEDQLNQISKVG